MNLYSSQNGRKIALTISQVQGLKTLLHHAAHSSGYKIEINRFIESLII
jgi:hypothetical protein